MQLLFTVCFGVGIGYTVLSLVLGELLDVLDFDGLFSFGSSVAPLKPAVLASFITVFGGFGLVFLNNDFNTIVAVALAFVLAMVVAICIYRFVIVPLSKAENTSAVERQALIGTKAIVRDAISQGRYGKITYVARGNTYNSPAKSEDGAPIEKGDEVEICYIRKQTFYVKKV